MIFYDFLFIRFINLILDDQIYGFIDNILKCISFTKNNLTLINSCLAFRIIIIKIDKIIKEQNVFNILENDKENLIENIKKSIGQTS